MNYIEVEFTCEPNNEIVTSVLSAMIADIGFESFVENEVGLLAYVQKSLYDEGQLQAVLDSLPIEADIKFECREIEDKNWNEEWEKNYFEPLVIDNRCIIQSTFHNRPEVYEYNIKIDPKMSFGTGHHQTTELMIRQILEMDLTDKSLLDMGCGTAILAILASMRGANPILAIDVDEWAYDNAQENITLNGTNNIDVKIGGAELLGNQTFDVILANINRNILLKDIRHYVAVLNADGELYMSGFYTDDIPAIEDECHKYDLRLVHTESNQNWAVVKFIKQK